MRKLLILMLWLAPSVGFTHARLISPVPRNNNSGIKTGPCGGLPRGASPMTLNAGATLTVQWEETIQHPGRYFISFSPANDAGFEANRLATVVDTQDGAISGVSHKYSANITVPNVACEDCSLQLIQSMEENPQAPTYYYSCADIRIVSAAGATPTPAGTPPNSTLNDRLIDGRAKASSMTKVGGGCGTVSSLKTSSSSGLIFLLPLLVWGQLFLIVRRQRLSRAL